MNWYKKAQIIYRGDTKPINIRDHNPEYASKILLKDLGSTAAMGPGLYFTEQKDVAQMYGEYITTKQINKANIITPTSPLFNHNQIKKMLQDVDKQTLITACSNWDENYSKGREIIIQQILEGKNAVEQLLNIWSEVFQHQKQKEFINLMVKHNIDGISINKNDVVFYVIYNKNILV